VVRELLERGANVNATTKKGNAAIHIASLGKLINMMMTHPIKEMEFWKCQRL